MAKPEQTEKATPKRRSEARNKGQVAKSADLSSAATFLTTAFILHVSLVKMMNLLGDGMSWAIQHAAYTPTLNSRAALTPYVGWVGKAFIPVGIIFAVTMFVGIAVNLAQVGVHLSTHGLKPNFGRLNPLSGLKRIFFSPQTLVNLAKQLIKMSVLVLMFYNSLHNRLPEMMALSEASPYTIITTIEHELFGISMRFGTVLLAIGGFDFFWERHRLEESLKMTKTEVRDEQKQQEGSREAKTAFKRRQRDLARRMMMAAVPKATVVVTNPTHFAVALMWDEKTMDAPKVVAKGADLMAKRVRDLARENGVPIVENPPLARALYRDVEIDSAVPVNLYAAVAKVIAFVYNLRSRPSTKTTGSLLELR
jgi:flagellar biosynthetic protein FlhB